MTRGPGTSFVWDMCFSSSGSYGGFTGGASVDDCQKCRAGTWSSFAGANAACREPPYLADESEPP